MLNLARPIGLTKFFHHPNRFSRTRLHNFESLCLSPSFRRCVKPTANQQLYCTSLIGNTEAQKPKVVVITGPTAVGKTDVSLLVAEKLNGEIISADSVQVYRGLDVGSAKIPVAERRRIPHHLIDILDPKQDFSAGDFFVLSRAAIDDILQRGKVPIVVGGTGFYLRWCLHGKPQTPSSTAQGVKKAQNFIAEMKADAEEQKGDSLSGSELWEVYASTIENRLGDPISAARIRRELNNTYRLERMVEILLTSGRPLGDLDHDRLAPLDYDFRCFFLNRPRRELYDRIGLRCEQMLVDGLLQESEWLLDQGLIADQNSATKAIGYRQSLEFLQGHRKAGTVPDAKGLLQMLAAMQAKSRGLCSDQLAWFRNDALFHWLDAAQDTSALAAELITRIQAETHEGRTWSAPVMSKAEVKDMRTYVYHQQILCRSSVQAAVLGKLSPPPSVGKSNHESAEKAAIEAVQDDGDALQEAASKRARIALD